MDYIFNKYLFDGSFSATTIFLWLSALVIVLITWKRKRSMVQKSVLWFVSAAFLLEYISSNRDLTGVISEGNNSPFYHIGVFFLFWLMSRIYYPAFGDLLRKRWKRFVLPGFVVFAIINAIWLDGFMNFPSLSIGLYSLTGIILPIFYMLKILRTLAIPRLDQDPLFIAASGLLIYFSGNFLLWLFLSYINFDYDFFYSIYRVNSVLTILLNVFLAYAVIIPVETLTKPFST